MFVSPRSLFQDSFRLAAKIYRSGFRPDWILVLWRGGAPIGMVVHEFLQVKRLPVRHAVLAAASYSGIGRRGRVRIEGGASILRRLPGRARVLIIDDILDSGATMAAVYRRVRRRTSHVKTATLYVKEDAGATFLPDYWVHRTRRWVVFPHEMAELSPSELRRKDPLLLALLR